MRKNKDIQDELESISPELSAIPFHEVYTAPEGYFEELTINIVSAMNEKKPIDLPVGYFENFSDTVINRIHQPGKLIPISKTRIFFRLSAAAVIAGLLGLAITYLLYKKDLNADDNSLAMQEARLIIKNNTFDKEFHAVSDEDMISYLEENGHDVNAALVASLSDDTEIPSATDFISNDNELDNYLQRKNIH